VLAVPDLGEVSWTHLSGGFWADVAYLAIGPTSISYVLFTRGVRDTGAGTASVMMFLVPVFGTAFSFLLLDESFTTLQAVMSLVMLTGAYLAVVSRGSGRKPLPDPAPGAVPPAPVPVVETIPSHEGDPWPARQ
jgi:drug/metabolite transporter (DMT)-like permease